MDYSFLLDAAIGAASATIAFVAFYRASRLSLKPVERGAPEAARPGTDPLVDPSTGLPSRLAWNEILRREEDRFDRYGRPVTVLVMELDGIDALAAAFGESVADRVIPPVATALVRNARAADVIARTGPVRFVGLLPETDEVAATNYIERMRTECDAWLEGGALAVRLAVGWAQPATRGYLTDALVVAEERMNADRRRSDFRPPRIERGDVNRRRPLAAVR